MKTALVVTDSAGGPIGNIDPASLRAHVANLERELVQLGHDPHVHWIDTDPIERVSKAAQELHDMWSLSAPDVVHAHLWPSGLATIAALRDLDVTHTIPVLLSLHTDIFDNRRHGSRPRMLRLEAAVARDADSVIATSQRKIADLATAGVRRGDVDVIPNGVDTSLFTPEGDQVQRGDSSRLISAGVMAPQSGFDTAIQALPYLRDVELVVAGSMPGGHASRTPAYDHELNRLRQLAWQLGVANRTYFIKLPDRRRLPHVLRSADIVVCTPWNDSAGSVALEAMACGRAVIAASVGSLPDEVIDGTTGTIVPPQDPRELAHAANRLINDPILRDGYGLAGVNRVRARYTWPRIASEVSSAYERLTAA